MAKNKCRTLHTICILPWDKKFEMKNRCLSAFQVVQLQETPKFWKGKRQPLSLILNKTPEPFHLTSPFPVTTSSNSCTAGLTMSQRFTARELEQVFLQPTALHLSVCSGLLLATGALPGRGPAWPLHVKCGPRVSEDMPSAT